MPTYYRFPADGTDGYDSSPLYTCQWNRVLVPELTNVQYHLFNFSVIPANETYVSIQMRHFEYLYTASKGVAKEYFIDYIQTNDATNTAVVLPSVTYTGLNRYDYLNNIHIFQKANNNLVRIRMNDPGVSNVRYMEGHTMENGTATYRPFLTVITSVPTGERKSYIIMAG